MHSCIKTLRTVCAHSPWDETVWHVWLWESQQISRTGSFPPFVAVTSGSLPLLLLEKESPYQNNMATITHYADAPYVQLLCKLWSNKTVEAPPHLNASNNCHRFISNITHSSYGHPMGLCRHLHSRLIISVSSKFRQQHLLHTQFINVRFSQNAFNKNIVVILVLTI